MTTLEKRLVSLDMANHNRIAKARLRARLGAGEISFADVLRDPPHYMQNELLYELLLWTPWVGRGRVRRFNMRAAHQARPVNLLAPIGELSEAQREWVIEQLPGLRRPVGV